mmetsp:Transcript_6291/g.20037  ORF Transcript_6291/g.20037 Transcript_6291/m.20037 type:complete len:163 (-) Transcript_6291:127-615(-)
MHPASQPWAATPVPVQSMTAVGAAGVVGEEESALRWRRCGAEEVQRRLAVLAALVVAAEAAWSRARAQNHQQQNPPALHRSPRVHQAVAAEAAAAQSGRKPTVPCAGGSKRGAAAATGRAAPPRQGLGKVPWEGLPMRTPAAPEASRWRTWEGKKQSGVLRD